MIVFGFLMLTFSGYMDNITIYIDFYWRVLILTYLTVVCLRHTEHRVQVATRSHLTEHESKTHACLQKAEKLV